MGDQPEPAVTSERTRSGCSVASVEAVGIFDTRQTLRANGQRYCASERNPWAYTHPGMNLLELVAMTEKLAATREEGLETLVKVMGPEVWPLPWYLRGFKQVGYWEELPDDPVAPLVIVDARWSEDVDPKLTDSHVPSMYGLRPGIILLLYSDENTWNTYLENIP